MFKKGNQYGKGRPKGSQNKAPNRDELISLLNRIINEFTDEFDALTNDEKLRILNTFRHLWKMEIENVYPIENNEIRISIVGRDDE